MYKQGHKGAPPPILIPIKFELSFLTVTVPDVTVIPLKHVKSVVMSFEYAFYISNIISR